MNGGECFFDALHVPAVPPATNTFRATHASVAAMRRHVRAVLEEGDANKIGSLMDELRKHHPFVRRPVRQWRVISPSSSY